LAVHPNYHQLLYFWAVVREGGVLRAAQSLHVTPQTVSGQLKLLERDCRGRLMRRIGRGLEPTDLGRAVYRYAEEIFARGLELAELVRTGSPHGLMPLIVGTVDAVSEATVAGALAPRLVAGLAAKLICLHGTFDALLADLAVHRLDLVLSPGALPSSSSIRGSSHLLAECDVVFFATPTLARRLKGRFPASLNGAPWLLPSAGTAVRQSLDGWFGRRGIVPSVVGEFDDMNLLRAFGARGAGVFSAPADLEAEIKRHHRVSAIGRTSEVRARVYAIAAERRIQHPVVTDIMSAG
jgi:LysR family transcriptional activator of nhaA